MELHENVNSVFPISMKIGRKHCISFNMEIKYDILLNGRVYLNMRTEYYNVWKQKHLNWVDWLQTIKDSFSAKDKISARLFTVS